MWNSWMWLLIHAQYQHWKWLSNWIPCEFINWITWPYNVTLSPIGWAHAQNLYKPAMQHVATHGTNGCYLHHMQGQFMPNECVLQIFKTEKKQYRYTLFYEMASISSFSNLMLSFRKTIWNESLLIHFFFNQQLDVIYTEILFGE